MGSDEKGSVMSKLELLDWFFAGYNALWVVLIAISTLILIRSLRKEKKEQRMQELNVSAKLTAAKKRPLQKAIHFINGMISSDQKEVDKKFISAGFYDLKWSRLFVPIKYMFLAIGIASLISFQDAIGADLTLLIVYCSLWLICVLVLPDMYLAIKAKALTRSISARLPYLLDVMAVCVQTGMTIEAAIRYLSKEMAAFDKDVSYLLVKVNDRSSLVGMQTALEELYERVPSNEMRSFVMTLSQSMHYGTSIYSVLTTLAADIREVQILYIEEQIGKLAAKMSVPLILFIMLPIVILVAAPGVMRMLMHA
jgi:tight adherence protein C